MISSYIFKRIFKSQQTNIDTICCIACHIINHIISDYSQSQGGQEDASLDVTDAIAGAGGGGAADKGSGGGGPGKGGKGGQGGEKSVGKQKKARADALLGFLKKMIGDIQRNDILKDAAPYFSFKRKVQAQLTFIEKQFKAVVDEKKSQETGA